MNREKEQKKAAKFSKAGQAYVKAEYDGKDNALMIAGDMVALLRVAEQIISRVADINGEDFASTWLVVKDIHEHVGQPETLVRGVKTPYPEGVEQ